MTLRKRQQANLSENRNTHCGNDPKGPIDTDEQSVIITELQRQSILQTNRAATVLSVVSLGAAVASILCREQSQIHHHYESSIIPSMKIVYSSGLHIVAASIAHDCKNLWKNHKPIIVSYYNDHTKNLFQKLGWKVTFGIIGISLYLISIILYFTNVIQQKDVSSDDDDDYYLYMRLLVFNILTMAGGIILHTDTIHTIRDWKSLESSKYNYKSL